MERSININQYSALNAEALMKIVSSDFHEGMKERFATVNLQLEIAHKLEPREEELEFAWASLKEMEKFFLEHIEKEQQLLFPLFNRTKKRTRLPEEDEELTDFVKGLIAEHIALKRRIAQIRKVTNNYTSDVSNTPSHKLAYAQLNDLEQDFNRLFFVEEEYLFPKAIRLSNK